MDFKFRSKRLNFREFLPSDAKHIFDLNADPEVIKYTGDPPFKNINEALDFIKNYNHYKEHGFGRWAVILKENDQFIGWCGLKYNEENEIDLGFRFFKSQWGKGYASESAKATIQYAKSALGMKSIIGRAAQNNVASIKVLEKLGFKCLKKSMCHGIPNAKYFVLDL